jgi:hypothetical protein
VGTAGAGYPDPGYVRRLTGAARFSWAAQARHNEPVTWDAYLERFHAARPGITEAILRRSVRGDREGAGDPYCWLAGAVPAHGRVLDLGCGSGPLPDRAADIVACSMTLMVTTLLPRVLAEITRVLRPGGLVVATVPAAGPLRARDRIITAGLVAALGRVPGYPAGDEPSQLPFRLNRAGLRAIADERARFGYPVRDHADADRLLASLYLPGLAPARYRLAQAWVRQLVVFRAEFPVPLRRITAIRGC